MKFFELYGDREISAAEHAAEIAAVRVAIKADDWREYDRLRFAAPEPVSWTLKKPTALRNYRGQMVDIDSVLSSDDEEPPTPQQEWLRRYMVRRTMQQQAAWLKSYALDRQAHRAAGWIYRFLRERGFINARA